jgi:single-strand DNA-binding protein
MYINKVTILGNLTRDPELRALPSGIKVASFSLATNRTWKDQAGKKQDATEYHNIVSFGKLAELIAQYSKKGSSLYVEGRLQTRSWDDKATGEKKYRTEIVVETFQFGPRPQADAGAAGSQTRVWRKDEEEKKGGAPAAPDSDGMDMIDYPSEDINAEDIPF